MEKTYSAPNGTAVRAWLKPCCKPGLSGEVHLEHLCHTIDRGGAEAAGAATWSGKGRQPAPLLSTSWWNFLLSLRRSSFLDKESSQLEVSGENLFFMEVPFRQLQPKSRWPLNSSFLWNIRCSRVRGLFLSLVRGLEWLCVWRLAHANQTHKRLMYKYNSECLCAHVWWERTFQWPEWMGDGDFAQKAELSESDFTSATLHPNSHLCLRQRDFPRAQEGSLPQELYMSISLGNPLYLL